MLFYIMQIHINLSEYYPLMCKNQTDQWDKNGKVFLTLEKEEKKSKFVLILMQE